MKAFLASDWQDTSDNALERLTACRDELERVTAWIEHWQRDVEAGLRPTASSLAMVAGMVRQTLKQTEQ